MKGLTMQPDLKTVLRHFVLRITLLVGLCLPTLSGEGQELSDFSLIPSISELGCNSTTSCIYDASRATRLFIYVRNSAELWVYPSDGGTSTHYDLSVFETAFGTTLLLDFVAISDTELLFIGTQFDNGENELTIYNLTTNQIRQPNIDFGDVRLTECDAMPSYPIDNLYVFPNSSRVLLCGISLDLRSLFIIDFSTEQIEQTIHIPFRRNNSALLPWLKVLVGHDGSVYIQSLAKNALEYLFPSVPQSVLESENYKVAKFVPLSETDPSLILLPLEPTQTDVLREAFVGTGIENELIAVDATGNLYWQNIHLLSDVPVPLITIYNPTGQIIGQVSSDVLRAAGARWYRYQSASGELIFLTETPGGIIEIEPEDYLPSTPPIANAGEDVTTTDTDGDGSELVTLDGSGSSDLDGEIESYVWTEVIEGVVTQIATGATPSVDLTVGPHTITLTVTDDDGATDTDEVFIKVNKPPIANAGANQAVTDSDNNGSQTVTLNGSGSTEH